MSVPLPTREEIERRVRRAVEELRRHDGHLLEVDANERSITHHLAVYLQREFEDMDVDVEYNRDGHEIKRLLTQTNVSSDDTDAVTVYPDIIVHRRGTNDNILVIEVKKRGGGNGLDEKKLIEFTKPLTEDGLGYRWGLRLILDSEERGKESLRCYEHGRLCDR